MKKIYSLIMAGAVAIAANATEATVLTPTLTLEDPYYAPGWNPSTNYTNTFEDGVWTIDMKDGTDSEWQAQFGMLTDIIPTADLYYGIAFDIVCTRDIYRGFFKLFPNGEDNNVVCDYNDWLKPNETIRIFRSGAGFNSTNALRLLFDFGGNLADTKVTISNIKFYSSTEDMPIEPGTAAPVVEELSATITLLNDYDIFRPNWNPSTNYTNTFEDGVWTIDMKDATYAIGEAVFNADTGLAPIEAAYYGLGFDIVSTTDTPNALYDLYVVIPPSEGEELAKMHYICYKSNSLKANEQVRFFRSGFCPGSDLTMTLKFDFGRNPANTKITISNIKFYKANDYMMTEPELGDNPDNPDDPDSGVSGIQTSGNAAYYTVDGVRVENPAKGLYIRIENGKAVKVVK